MSNSPASAETILRHGLDALARGDLDAYFAMFDQERFRFLLQGTTSISGEVHGLANFKEWAAMVLTRLRSFTQRNIQLLSCENWVITRDRGESITLDGREYNNEYARFWRFDQGKCVEMIEYLDTKLVSDIFDNQ